VGAHEPTYVLPRHRPEAPQSITGTNEDQAALHRSQQIDKSKKLPAMRRGLLQQPALLGHGPQELSIRIEPLIHALSLGCTQRPPVRGQVPVEVEGLTNRDHHLASKVLGFFGTLRASPPSMS
jgi:hypothetical protein